MALSPQLQELIDTRNIGFEEVFELYAAMCIEQVRDMVNDMIEDEGIPDLIKNGMSITVEGLTEQAVDWGHDVVPEMLSDIIDGPKKPDESWLQYVIRCKIEQRVKEVKAFTIKVV